MVRMVQVPRLHSLLVPGEMCKLEVYNIMLIKDGEK